MLSLLVNLAALPLIGVTSIATPGPVGRVAAVSAVSFVASGTLATSATVTPISITSPACVIGDLLICCLLNKELNTTISAPDITWTEIKQSNADCTTAADDFRYAIFWKIAVASGASFSFSKSADNNVLFAGVISVWRGHNALVPLDATAAAHSINVAQADAVTFPAFDPTSVNGHAVFVSFYGNDLTTMAAAMSADTNPDCTTRADDETNQGTDCSISITSGATDGSNIASRTWASSSTADAGSAGVVFSLVPL